MAITRRQFVTRLGALAAAVGFSQADVSKLAEAFAGNTTNLGGTGGKPRVIWVHGAECTGCSTSLLGILESPNGHPVAGDFSSATTTGVALGAAGVNATTHLSHVTSGNNPFSLWTDGAAHDGVGAINAVEGSALVNIADVVIDVIDLQYHETVMGMGGDLAAQWLKDFKDHNTGTFVLVVEGALQDKTLGGAWGDTSDTSISWCSIGVVDSGVDAGYEIDMPSTVVALANNSGCAAVIPIGQCACFGGYPGCKPPITAGVAGGFSPAESQTGAMGVSAYFGTHSGPVSKVVNVPGCPTNPWWFVMTVVLFVANLEGTDLITPTGGIDTQGRLKAVYPVPVHGPWCPRYSSYTSGVFALKPGDPGCLKNIGCKGIVAKSQCGWHGWNNQQPQNGSLSETGTGKPAGIFGGHCTKAGHPCMACTEKGYPDAFVPFVRL